MKRILTILLIIILMCSCTKEYMTVMNFKVNIGKIKTLNNCDTCVFSAMFQGNHYLFDTIYQDINSIVSSYNFDTLPNQFYRQSISYYDTASIVNIDPYRFSNLIPNELINMSSGFIGNDIYTNELYYIGFEEFNCHLKDKGEDLSIRCYGEENSSDRNQGAYFYDNLVSNDKNISLFFVGYGVPHYYFISQDNNETLELKNFFNTLKKETDNLIKQFD